MKSSCASRYGPARLDLDRQRVTVARRPALHDVGDVDVGPGEPDALDERVSSWPARPTNGSPCRSSCSPGPSPTNIRSACGSPTPKTTWVRVAASGTARAAERVHAPGRRTMRTNGARDRRSPRDGTGDLPRRAHGRRRRSRHETPAFLRRNRGDIPAADARIEQLGDQVPAAAAGTDGSAPTSRAKSTMQPVDHVGPLEHQHVAAALEQLEAGTRDQRGPSDATAAAGVMTSAVPHDHERRRSISARLGA